MRMKIFSILLLTLGLSWGQRSRLQTPFSASAGLSYEIWTTQYDRISQLALPFSILYPVNDRVQLYTVTSPAFSQRVNQSTFDLNGMSDIRVGGHCLAFNDLWLFTFGMNLPSGKNALSREEYVVSSILTLPALNFKSPSLGQGFDVQAGATTAREVGDFLVGAGVNVLLKGAYSPYSDTTVSYNPGEEITWLLGVSRGGLSADLLYTLYFDDALEGEKIFRSGNTLLLQVLGRFAVSDFQVSVHMRGRLKGKNQIAVRDTTNQMVLQTDAKNLNNNQFSLTNVWAYPLSDVTQINAMLDLKLYADNDNETGGVTLFGLGMGAGHEMGRHLKVTGDIKYYFGELSTVIGSVKTSGLSLSGGVVYTL